MHNKIIEIVVIVIVYSINNNKDKYNITIVWLLETWYTFC